MFQASAVDKAKDYVNLFYNFYNIAEVEYISDFYFPSGVFAHKSSMFFVYKQTQLSKLSKKFSFFYFTHYSDTDRFVTVMMVCFITCVIAGQITLTDRQLTRRRLL